MIRRVIRRDGSVDLEDKSRLSAEKAKQIIKNTLGDYIASQLQSLGKEERVRFLRQLKRIEGLSIRQIARITGFTFNVAAKAQDRYKRTVPLYCFIEPEI